MIRKVNQVKLLIFLALIAHGVFFGVPGGDDDFGIGSSSGYFTPGLPPLATEVQIDPQTTELLRDIAERYQQRRESEKKEHEAESEERPFRKRRTQEETDKTDVEMPQPAEDQPVAVDRPITMTELLSRIGPALQRGDSNLVRTITRRYLATTILLDELSLTTRSPTTIILTVAAFHDRRVRSNHIRLIGQTFSHIKELDFAYMRLKMGDEELQTLSQQAFASQLTSLAISSVLITPEGIAAHMSAFTGLTRLNIPYIKYSQKILAALSQQSFASHLIELDVSGNYITVEGIRANMDKFIALTRLRIGNNNMGDEGLAALAEQPFAHILIELTLNSARITAKGVAANVSAFMGLTHLNIADNSIGDAGLAAIAQQEFASRIILLEIDNNQITARGVAASMHAFISLMHLDISENPIEDAGLAAIAQQKYAHNLTLRAVKTQITRAGLEENENEFKKLNTG